MSPALFRAHLELFATSGYDVVTVSTALERLASDSFEPTVALTFDDAYADFAENALPALREYGLPATLFVPTAYVCRTAAWLRREGETQRPIMSWDDLREAVRAGIECGAHSHSHPELDRLDNRALALKVCRPKELLKTQLDCKIRTFAYPFGFHSRRVRDAARKSYAAACEVGNRVCDSDSDRYALPRCSVTDTTSTSELALLLQRRSGRRHVAVSTSKRIVWQARRRWLPSRA